MNARYLQLILGQVLFLTLFACIAAAQGFAGLGTSVEGYDVPRPDKKIVLPEDHASHPRFRIEWWYLTGNLKGEDGLDYGIQWTLFRSATKPPDAAASKNGPSGWSNSQFWMGHAAVTSAKDHFVTETIVRGGIGVAGVTASPFKAHINDWSMQSQSGKGIENLALKASGEEFAYTLNLQSTLPIIRHGKEGYSVKSQKGQASYYYSQPSYGVDGVLNLPKGPVKVKGSAWLDHEWSSQPLGNDQLGWDWVSLNFDDGSKLMGFSLRETSGNTYTSATWINGKGRAISYPNGALKMIPLSTSKVENREVPTQWRIQLPQQELDIEISALNNQSWMKTSVPYWEGPVVINGSHTGKGYLEMTGYSK